MPSNYSYGHVGFFVPGEKVDLKPQMPIDSGRASEFEVDEALPAGLNLDHETGEISGTLSQYQKLGEFPFVITAKNDVGLSKIGLTIAVVNKPGSFTYPEAVFAPGSPVSLLPQLRGHHDSITDKNFSIRPNLLKGLLFRQESGMIEGALDEAQAQGDYTFMVTAANKAGRTELPVTMSVMAVPRAMHYPEYNFFYTCRDSTVSPTLHGKQALNVTYEPEHGFPPGLWVEPSTGKIKGRLQDIPMSHRKNYSIVAKNKVGSVSFPVNLDLVKEHECSALPWWVVPGLIASLLLGGCFVFLFCRKEEKGTYQKLPDPVPIIEGPAKVDWSIFPDRYPKGLRLTWSTPDGEQTVIAQCKPLGLVYEKRAPLQVASNKECHGKMIGIAAGWILTKVHECDVRGRDFNEIEKILSKQVDKLPPEIQLKFDTGGGTETVWLTKRIGLEFDEDAGTIARGSEESSSEKGLSIKKGWTLTSVNYQDVSARSWKEMRKVLNEEMDKLPPV